MSQPEQKQSRLKRIRELSLRRIDDRYLLLIVAAFFALLFLVSSGLEAFVGFMISWTAGILGILTGFALDRTIERSKDDKTKKDFLTLIHNELTEIKGQIPPQTKTPIVLYPEAWDSFVSSGLVRLLSPEQVTKLSSVYRLIKGTQNEAERVRQAEEEYSRFPDVERDSKQFLYERYKSFQDAYERHGKQLSQQIEKIFEEKWWS